MNAYGRLLREMNRKMNLVSRESEGEIETLHIPHVLALALHPFPAGAVVVDWGTGGGLPAIPLAIAFPSVKIHAVDAVEKKVLAVRTMARRLGLTNLEAWSGDAAKWLGRASHSVSRATAPLVDLWRWHARVSTGTPVNAASWRAGLVCLKGGDLTRELAELEEALRSDADEVEFAGPNVEVIPIRDLFSNPYFGAKCIVHVYSTPPAE